MCSATGCLVQLYGSFLLTFPCSVNIPGKIEFCPTENLSPRSGQTVTQSCSIWCCVRKELKTQILFRIGNLTAVFNEWLWCDCADSFSPSKLASAPSYREEQFTKCSRNVVLRLLLKMVCSLPLSIALRGFLTCKATDCQAENFNNVLSHKCKDVLVKPYIVSVA